MMSSDLIIFLQMTRNHGRISVLLEKLLSPTACLIRQLGSGLLDSYLNNHKRKEKKKRILAIDCTKLAS